VRLLAGSDDPFVPLGKGEELAERLGSELTVVPGGGHLISQHGYAEFRQLWEELQVVWGHSAAHDGRADVAA
jgi:predicted alpha/beta hydrolase family esterase